MTNNFSNFYSSLDADPAKRGKQFERFVKWFLKVDPEWSTQVDQIWLWEEWPERWGADCGIDLVFRHKNGEHWAVQAKCYSPDYDITKHDVDKFLSESNRPLIKHRLLIATTDRIGGNAKQVCDGQEKPVIRFMFSDFEKAPLDYSTDFASLSQGKRKPRPTPNDGHHPHQPEAIDAVVRGLQTANRGQLIMACGTGKTYVTLWIKEHLAAQRTLVLVPSLGLLSQLLREWTFAATTPFEVLCVCSDQTVGTKGNDEAIHSVADLAFPVTSDADEVKNFLNCVGNRVVFSTYQSSSVIAAAQADTTIPAFDLVVADEAHRCAGKVGSEFTTILDNTQIRSAKRLFATATPRTYSSTVHKAAEDRGVEVIGMDNATLFGEVLYTLPFGKAIKDNLLTDYRVVIIGVDDPTIAQWITNRELVTTNTGIETDSESLAAQIGLLKAIKDYDLKRIISFHSRVKRAEAFTTEIKQAMAWVSDEHRPSGTLRTDFVSGDMPANKRKIKLDQLKALNVDQRGVLSNARCLSEGVDVPSLDGVAFIDPRSSQVDIIQAVGRAIRLSPDKKIGTIVLPVFIAAGENAEDTIEASNFKPIWDVLSALKAHDDVLAYELDQIRTSIGRQSIKSVNADSLRKISIDLPATVNHTFGSALRTHLVEQVTESWNSWFGKLQAFKDQFGHCNVTSDWNEVIGLSGWVSTQRNQNKKGILIHERVRRLHDIGFVFDYQKIKTFETWMKHYKVLKDYVLEFGHPNVPRSYLNKKLANWVMTQRTEYSEDQLEENQINLLDKLGFRWDPHNDGWMENYLVLEAFKINNGHCNVETVKGVDKKLLTWVKSLRSKKQVNLNSDRLEMLNKIDFNWDSNLLDSKWQELYHFLKQYHSKFGDSNVPDRWKDNLKLSGWVKQQRINYKNSKLPESYIYLLNQIDFRWAQKSRGTWDDNIASLIAYKHEHGNFNVSLKERPKLYQFIVITRNHKKYNKLTDNQLNELNDIGFQWVGFDKKR